MGDGNNVHHQCLGYEDMFRCTVNVYFSASHSIIDFRARGNAKHTYGLNKFFSVEYVASLNKRKYKTYHCIYSC